MIDAQFNECPSQLADTFIDRQRHAFVLGDSFILTDLSPLPTVPSLFSAPHGVAGHLNWIVNRFVRDVQTERIRRFRLRGGRSPANSR